MFRVKSLLFIVARKGCFADRSISILRHNHGINQDLSIRAATAKINSLLGLETGPGTSKPKLTLVDNIVDHREGLQGDLYSVPFKSAKPTSGKELTRLHEGIQGSDYDSYSVWSKNKLLLDKNSNAGTWPYGTTSQQIKQLQCNCQARRPYSTEPKEKDANPESASAQATLPSEGNLSQKDRLKRAVKEYGATVIVFHVCISLISLGSCYMAVSSGIDMIAILSKLGVGESILQSKAVAGAGTFVVSYAVHKVFAPVRIAITLTSTPFIVRYLRGIGFLKPPKPKM